MKKLLFSLFLIFSISYAYAAEPVEPDNSDNKLKELFTAACNPPANPEYQDVYKRVLCRLYYELPDNTQLQLHLDAPEIQKVWLNGETPASDAEMEYYNHRIEKDFDSKRAAVIWLQAGFSIMQ